MKGLSLGVLWSHLCVAFFFFFFNSHPHTPSLFPVRPRPMGPASDQGCSGCSTQPRPLASKPRITVWTLQQQVEITVKRNTWREKRLKTHVAGPGLSLDHGE